jgi:hypothetical protein
MDENKSWHKNIDSNFISGEDLLNERKGLKKSMNVMVERFDERETFDQNNNAKILKDALYLKEVDGPSLYKPVLLNKTNAMFFDKLTGSDKIFQWVGIEVVLFAQPDKRFGHVARFRKAPPKKAELDPAVVARFKACTNGEDLKAVFMSLSSVEKTTYDKVKNAKKAELENANQ